LILDIFILPPELTRYHFLNQHLQTPLYAKNTPSSRRKPAQNTKKGRASKGSPGFVWLVTLCLLAVTRCAPITICHVFTTKSGTSRLKPKYGRTGPQEPPIHLSLTQSTPAPVPLEF